MSDVHLEAIAEKLFARHEACALRLPTRADADRLITRYLATLFPELRDHPAHGVKELTQDVANLATMLRTLMAAHPSEPAKKHSAEVIVEQLPELQDWLRDDARAIEQGDPAARGESEVILTYPGFLAIAVYRLAHELYEAGALLVARLLSECAHARTGIDIHPGATIGRHFCIDHGTGVVIGETALIGNHVKLYQGVTLGALSVEKCAAHAKRHPTLEDHVVVYSNATILGGGTVIGEHTIIGGNVWITSSVPAHSVVHHQPAQQTKVRSSRGQ